MTGAASNAARAANQCLICPSFCLRRARNAVWNHLVAENLEPAQRSAVENGIAGIDRREATIAADDDAAELRRMGDYHALGAERGQNDVELLVGGKRRWSRLGRGP